MLKRKYGDRLKWKRIKKRKYAQSFMNSQPFTGHITLLKMVKVSHPLIVSYEEHSLCIANDGYTWLQHFPQNQHHAVTTMFNQDGDWIQSYIDICVQNGVDQKGVPWLEDLFLDLIVLSTGEVIVKDEDELKEGLQKEMIEQELYDLAWQEGNRIINDIKDGKFEILNLAKKHRDDLLKNLK
ncbi:DUF402 domain-containing protein [Alkalihalobacillus sp. 1P02AB]|uniref:DUF402 domain-containing protein n=1 Tax=Alkalihalobacillus sp. 1P02AB TaxID=3132260 RepID=UPI0039A459AF